SLPAPLRHHLQPNQGHARQVNERVDPVAARGWPFFWKSERKMQEERRLQGLGDNLAPIDGPIKGVEFTRVVERVKNKRCQAKNVKMGGARGRPPPEEHIQADRKVNQCNQPQSLVETTIGGLKNDGGM